MAGFWRPGKIGRISGLILATLLVLFALVVSLIRSLLPQLHQARDKVTDYLWDNYRVKVEIAELSAQWQAFGPALTVNGLVLPAQDGLPLSLNIKRTEIKLDFWQTLLERSPSVENVVFDGVRVVLDLDAMAVAPGKVSTGQTGGTDWLYRLLLEQLQHFAMREAMLELRSSQHEFRPIYLGDLRWRNLGGRHRAEGYVYLDAGAPLSERLQLQIDLKGNGHDPDSIHGQAYLLANSLDVGEWAARRPNPFDNSQPMPLNGVVNLQAWAEVANRQLTSILVQFDPSYLEWPTPTSVQRLEVAGGSLAWKHHGLGWFLGSDGLEIVSNGNDWPTLELSAHYDGQRLAGMLSSLELAALTPLIPLIPGLDKQGLQTLIAMAPEGRVEDIRINWTAPVPAIQDKTPTGRLQASARVAQLAWQASGAIPGLAPLSARLYANNAGVRASLEPQQLTVDFGSEFKAPLSFATPGIELGYRFADNSLISPSVKLDNPDLSLDAAVKFGFAPASLSLAADVTVHDASRAGYYFPRQAMGAELADYLEGAIIGGRTEQAAVVWQGELADFPYDDGSGVFQAGFVLADGHYAFQPDWPAVTDLKLRALFENARMDIWVDEGQLKRVNAAGAHVYIPAMTEHSTLKVEAALATTGPAATAVLKDSPLKDSVGSVLEVVQVQGNVRGDLDLTIPLYQGPEPDIRGLVLFDDTAVYLETPGLQLTRLRGELTFANDEIRAGRLSARIFGQPTTFDITGDQLAQGYRVTSSLKGGWDLDRMPESFANPLSPFYQGVLAWQGKMTLDLPKGGDFRLDASASSSLRNLTLDLPSPYQKPMGEQRQLDVKLTGDGQRLALGVTLADQGEFNASINPGSGKMEQFHLRLADTPPSGKKVDAAAGQNASARAKSATEAATEVAINKVKDALETPVGRVLADGLAAVGIEVNEPAAGTPAPGMDETHSRGNTGSLEVALRRADFDEWLRVINSFIGDSKARIQGEDEGFFPPLNEIRVSLGALQIFGQDLTQPQIHARPQDGLWRISTESAEFAGDIDIFPDWQNGGMKIRASRLYLGAEDDGSEAAASPAKDAASATADASSHPSRLPPLAVDVDDFRLYGKRLGHLVLQGQPEQEAYRFDTLSIRSDAATLRGQGEWRALADGQQTRMNFSLDAERFDALTTQLGLEPGIKDSPLKLSAGLYWQGAPQDFALANLGGGVTFNLGKGSLSEVSDKGARLFSLFSLDSLVRKLSLDFSDVFGKGMYYHSFSGTLELDNGVVKTRDTEIDAIAGNMKVRGFTDLTTKSLNYDIRFVPQLASSVPTVVLLSTSAWTMGLGAFALTKVLEPVIEVISEIRFRLTGTMKEPVIEELERKSKEIEIPESVLPRTKQADGTVAPLMMPDMATPNAPAAQPLKSEPAVEPKPAAEPEPEPDRVTEPNTAPQPTTKPQSQAALSVLVQPLQWIDTPSAGEFHADKSAAMPEQPRCCGQSSLYRIAA